MNLKNPLSHRGHLNTIGDKMLTDKRSQWVSTALNFLFIRHPARTALGIFFGTALSTLAKLFSPALKHQKIIDPAAVSSLEMLLLGVFLAHLTTVMELFTKRTYLSENEEKALEMIRIAKERGQITDWEAKNLYVKLCENVLANAELKQSTKDEIRQNLQ